MPNATVRANARTLPAEARLRAQLAAAEVALIAMPGADASGVWAKFELLEHLVVEDRVNGENAFPLVVLALASLKPDVLAIGLDPN